MAMLVQWEFKSQTIIKYYLHVRKRLRGFRELDICRKTTGNCSLVYFVANDNSFKANLYTW